MKKTIQLLASLGLMLWGVAHAETGSGTGVGWGALNLPVGVTETSREIHDLHMLILWICVGIGILVYGILIYSLIHHRKSKGAVPAQFHENTKLEIVWTIIPFLILLAMAVPATNVMIKAYDTDKVEKAQMTIKVTGYQWKWRYTYLDEGIDFFSSLDAKSNAARQLGSKIDPTTVEHYLLNVDHPLVVPVNKKIRILLTAADVLHAWWVPEFGWKKDAIPGFVTDGWIKVEKPGIYRGQCAELCGRDHGFMPIVVIAKNDEDYKKWVAEQQAQQQASKSDASKTYTLDELMVKGKEVYKSSCAACHSPEGEGTPGVFPAIKGSSVALGSKDDHVKLVVDGKNAMPAFKDQLSPVELAAVITYQRNGFGNNKGDVIQPSEIQAHQ
ncbi:MAG: cytochrome c oxidase subunit II [Methylococcaceae bacterium]|nr:cytochrome c oxidase subunit II [Methylococcaceae bacterium]